VTIQHSQAIDRQAGWQRTEVTSAASHLVNELNRYATELLFAMSIIAKIRALITLGQGMSRGISELTADNDPIALFANWFESARRAGLVLPEAMTVATATKDGCPSARMMLLKGYGEDGFVFYTNYESRKSMELAENPQVALVFHWPTLQRQIRIEGEVERLSTEESAAYFKTRPRGSCIGAWSSKQSSLLESRTELEQRVREHQQRFASREVPLPPFWGGYRVRPTSIEFWQGRVDRLHDRLRYRCHDGGWAIERLYP
jgi:pyridoxamine 5'-phosphate oxidase